MSLNYNTPTTKGGAGQFNGNISEIIWSAAGMEKQSYGYSYDPLDRLTKALYYNQDKPLFDGRFNELIWDDKDNSNEADDEPGYDLNGNIEFLVRNGKRDETSFNFGLMDDLRYTYLGNQLTRVDDARPKNDHEEGFKELVKEAGEYTYDDNGNMRKDANKGITSITYNHLNLPLRVEKSSAEYIIYTYDATGRKLSQQVFGTTAKTTDYIGEFIYENNDLQFINHEEGRIVRDNSPGATRPWEYQYHLTTWAMCGSHSVRKRPQRNHLQLWSVSLQLKRKKKVNLKT